jgi:hypothetical protein
MENSIILGMCYTSRHDFGLLSEDQQKNIYREMNQLYFHNVKPVIKSLHDERANMTKTHAMNMRMMESTIAKLREENIVLSKLS